MKATARELANSAADAFDAGEYELALERFRKARGLYPAPTLSLMEGRTLVQLGRWVEAFERFNETARTTLEPDAPEAFERAVQDGATEASRLDNMLPRLQIRAPDADVEVMLDGRSVPKPLLDVLQPIDPGEHQLTAAHDGSVYFERQLSFPAGHVEVVNVPSPPDLASVPAADDSSDGSADVPRVVSGRDTPQWIAPVAFGVAGAGAGAAVVTLALAADRKSRLDAVCDPGCPESARGDLDAFRVQRTLFFVSAGVAVVGLGVGGYFTLWGSDDESVALRLSPVGGELRARF